MRSVPRLALAALALALVTSAAAEAPAYCRASTCAEGQLCGPPPWDDPACKPLLWKRPCVGVSVQVEGSEEVPYPLALAVVEESFRAWEEPVCETALPGPPNIHVQNLGPVACDRVEYNSKAGNANVVVFRDATWTHPDGPHNIALTTVTFDTKTGEIYDADMEVNTHGFPFTTSDNPEEVQTDLLSVMTHEAGHFLGLAHAEDANATMWPNYTSGSLLPRTLAADDIAAICEVYPPTGEPVDTARCNPLPRHGFSPECAAKQTEGDCSVRGAAGSGEAGDAAPALALVALGIVCARRIRARSARRGR
ncbi:matrixin family metalloprotease [Polyangium sp. 15x6]|uniref:matrixin family metalloprotease n=1 Tax=Polyangium sp. 15x6 TaxID=3042687 RepID=UPI00249CB2F0|nr:matrixin family metalloprotease [Polyangium sp. 15x6]MDI3291566.1 matrixin family metalloprotease [Polyangium sp. 15x6]